MDRKLAPAGQRDPRGKARDRRRRKIRMLAWWGDGEKCACVHCGCELTFATMEQDRIEPGGSYRFDNLQPSCGDCNKRRSNVPALMGMA